METYWKHDCSLGAGGYPQFNTGTEQREEEMKKREGVEEMKGECWKENKKKIKIKSGEKLGVTGVDVTTRI